MDSKTSSPEGITVAAATLHRIPNTPLPAPLPPHVPCLWIEAVEGGDFVRADALTCPVCGAPMAVDEDRIFAESNDFNGWLEGTVLTRCTANDEHDSEMRFRREHVALISAAVRKDAITRSLNFDGYDEVLYRTWGDPRVRIDHEAAMADDAIILAYLSDRDGTEADVWEEILEEICEDDPMNISVTKIEEGESTYDAWMAVLGSPEDDLMARIRAAPAYRVVCEKRDIAICTVCYENDDGEFVTVDGTRYCRVCGAEYVDSPMAWDDDRREEREFEEPVEAAPMEEN